MFLFCSFLSFLVHSSIHCIKKKKQNSHHAPCSYLHVAPCHHVTPHAHCCHCLAFSSTPTHQTYTSATNHHAPTSSLHSSKSIQNHHHNLSSTFHHDVVFNISHYSTSIHQPWQPSTFNPPSTH